VRFSEKAALKTHLILCLKNSSSLRHYSTSTSLIILVGELILTAGIFVKGRVIKHPVFVIPRLVSPLLGLPAIKELELLTQWMRFKHQTQTTRAVPKSLHGTWKTGRKVQNQTQS